MWSGSRSQILDLWLWHCMMSRMASREVYGQILPLVMSRGRNLLEDRGRQTLVLSVHLVRGLLGVIGQSHSFSRLIRLTRLSSSGHEHLALLMIRHTSLRHWLCLIMPLRASRGLLFLIQPRDSHAMLHSSLRGLHLHILGLELSRPLLPLH